MDGISLSHAATEERRVLHQQPARRPTRVAMAAMAHFHLVQLLRGHVPKALWMLLLIHSNVYTVPVHKEYQDDLRRKGNILNP
jgi:hypothetical protein